jgi:hypothetical protein
MVARPEQVVPVALSMGGWGQDRDRLFGEEQRQDSMKWMRPAGSVEGAPDGLTSSPMEVHHGSEGWRRV